MLLGFFRWKRNSILSRTNFYPLLKQFLSEYFTWFLVYYEAFSLWMMGTQTLLNLGWALGIYLPVSLLKFFPYYQATFLHVCCPKFSWKHRGTMSFSLSFSLFLSLTLSSSWNSVLSLKVCPCKYSTLKIWDSLVSPNFQVCIFSLRNLPQLLALWPKTPCKLRLLLFHPI